MYKEITGRIIGAAIKVHETLGPGLLESVYQVCLQHELEKEGFLVEKEKALPVVYDGMELDAGYRIDLLVDGKIVLELKAVKQLNEYHTAQMLTYLKLSKNRVGLIINFHHPRLTEGIKRIIV